VSEPAPLPAPLAALARAHGIDTVYEDAFGSRREVGPETACRLLAALGQPIGGPAEAEAILEDGLARSRTAARPLPPVVVAWEGELPELPVGPGGHDGVAVELLLESGGDPGLLVTVEARGGESVAIARGRLPYGLHHVVVEREGANPSGEPALVWVISAPRHPSPMRARSWGVVVPVFALHDTDGHRGDLTCLERAGRLFAGAGAGYVATLPILAGLSRRDDPGGRPAPYSPLSRLWWNEGYLDAARVPELAALLPTGSGTGRGPFDPGARAALLRPLLESAERAIRRAGGPRLARYEAFLASRPDALAYSRFRAAIEGHGPDPAMWPERWRAGAIAGTEVDAGAVGAHLVAQVAMDLQVAEVAAALGRAGAGLVLDLPVGCAASGYDPFAHPRSYASGASVGAPPDRFFSEGQDWGLAPLDPDGERGSGYPVTAGALRHVLRHCAAARLDHVMGLSRLWWVPAGMEPADGAYVRYRFEEQLALCCLEAWRHDTALIGEDLGTVEPALVAALGSHGVAGMHVAVFDLDDDAAHPMEPLRPRPGSVALVDTHDTATFAGWFEGADIATRRQLGLLGEDEALDALASRARSRRCLVDRLCASDLLRECDAGDAVAVHSGLLCELGESEAGLVLVNPEDCWGETDPQNLPGTSTEHLNFARPFALRVSELGADERVLRAMARLGAARCEGASIDEQPSSTPGGGEP
jgi:4-alpha-glucanotransferase